MEVHVLNERGGEAWLFEGLATRVEGGERRVRRAGAGG